MNRNRTAPSPTAPRLGLIPPGGLIPRRPSGGSKSTVVIGAGLILIGLFVFGRALNTDRITFGYDATAMSTRWNELALETGHPLLVISELSPRPDESGDLVFGHQWSPSFSLRGRADPDTLALVEISVIGNRDTDGGEVVVDAMDLLLRVTEPELGDNDRLETLRELGVVGGDPNADLAASRGDTDYIVAAEPVSGNVGMSAAPHSSVATRAD